MAEVAFTKSDKSIAPYPKFSADGVSGDGLFRLDYVGPAELDAMVKGFRDAIEVYTITCRIPHRSSKDRINAKWHPSFGGERFSSFLWKVQTEQLMRSEIFP